jgi:hypothetical protein
MRGGDESRAIPGGKIWKAAMNRGHSKKIWKAAMRGDDINLFTVCRPGALAFTT